MPICAVASFIIPPPSEPRFGCAPPPQFHGSPCGGVAAYGGAFGYASVVPASANGIEAGWYMFMLGTTLAAELERDGGA